MNTIASRGLRPIPTTPVALRLVSRAWQLAQQVVNFYRNRRHMTVLSGMSDHELNDIGLVRADIAAVGALPAGQDPTSALAAIVQERRHWRRGR